MVGDDVRLFDVPADRHAYFVQSLEDRFYRPDEAERVGAALTLDLPVAFITEASWIAEHARRAAPRRAVPPRPQRDRQGRLRVARAVQPRLDEPLRMLVEGQPGGVVQGGARRGRQRAAMREPHHLTVVSGGRRSSASGRRRGPSSGPLTHREMAGALRRSDVVLKLTHVEGMFGPPLEGFHMGATCVTTPVTGHDEYIEHGWNGLVVDWDDARGTARLLDLLARDRR